MSERACVRGCTVKDVHFAQCADFGSIAEVTECKGCVPVMARDGVLICDREYRRLQRLLDDAPDLVGHLRSIADPTKAAVYDKVLVSSSRPEMPAPVAADLIDASNDIVKTLRAWALYIQHGPDHTEQPRHLEAGIDAATAYDEAHRCVLLITGVLDELANDSHQIGPLCEAVIDTHGSHPEFWSVADAAARWTLDDRPRWAQNPCPECDLKTVRVTPPKFRGSPARYLCRDCGWEADDTDEGGFWAEAFADTVPALEDSMSGAPEDYEERDLTEDPKYWMEQ